MKKYLILFIVACMVLCLIPSVGMLFFPTTKTTENKAMAEPPKLITEEGAPNKAFFSDFENYFNEHIALRNQLLYSDAMIQSTLFRESNVSGVIYGTDGWLYYSSTLNDYLGTNVLSERQLYNLGYNFRLIQDYVEAQGKDFVLLIAPNKNTLYGDNMPYYKSYVVKQEHSAVLLGPILKQQNVNYLDLFKLFEAQEEVLYLKQDSHWNMKGANLAYNGIMDSLNLPHEDYSDTTPVLTQNENGDLNKMLYSFYGQPEQNYDYNLTQAFSYTSNEKDVEGRWLITENPSGTGTLLMFRDSFANTLIPFLSNEFHTAYYSKGEPNALARYMETYNPDYVVIEKVERNIANYLNNPPILTPAEVQLPEKFSIAATDSTVQAETCMNDMNYYVFSGVLDESRVQVNSKVLVRVNDRVYSAYLTEENGYALYLKKTEFTDPSAQIMVYIVNEDQCVQAVTAQLNLPQ